jgi:hypothetical protein
MPTMPHCWRRMTHLVREKSQTTGWPTQPKLWMGLAACQEAGALRPCYLALLLLCCLANRLPGSSHFRKNES